MIYPHIYRILPRNNFSSPPSPQTKYSFHNTLYYQAGAGIVIKSIPKKELQEVDNKLGALRKSMQKATKIHQKLNV